MLGSVRKEFVLVLVLATSGCVKYLDLYSDPSGAVITEKTSGSQFVTPVTLKYSNPRVGPDGCVIGDEFEVRWASGVTRSYQPRMCGDGTKFTDVVKRPAGTPGLATDRQVEAQQVAELQSQLLRQQKNAETAGHLLGAALVGAASGYASGSDSSNHERRAEDVYCYSDVIGDSVYTRCR